jgi:hypothetical protein
MTIRILILCGLLGAAAKASLDQPVVNTELLTIALAEPVDGLFYHDGESVQPFVANLTGLSQPQRYRGPQRLVIRADETAFDVPPPLPPGVASLMLPANSSRVLLVCVKEKDAPLRIAAYDISSKDRAGDYRFFNFSDKPLSFNMGDQRFHVAPGKDFLASHASWRAGVLDLPIQVAAVEGKQPKLVYSSIWGHRPGRRNFVFTFNGRHPTKPITCCRFFDIPPDLAGQP